MRINHRGDIERERVPFMVICKERGSSLAKKSFLLFYLIKMSNGCLSLSWSKNETNGGGLLFPPMTRPDAIFHFPSLKSLKNERKKKLTSSLTCYQKNIAAVRSIVLFPSEEEFSSKGRHHDFGWKTEKKKVGKRNKRQGSFFYFEMFWLGGGTGRRQCY